MAGDPGTSPMRVLSVHRPVGQNSAHAYGPFGTYDEAKAFDDDCPEDNCLKTYLPLVGPLMEDIERAVEWEATHGHQEVDPGVH